MRAFNRLIVILLLAGIGVAGVFAVVYSFELLGYRLEDLFGGFSGARSGLESFVGAAEGGELTPPVTAILVLISLAGLVLLVLELKPRRRRHVRMGWGTYVSRGVVEGEVAAAAEDTSDVLGSAVRVKAKRRPGAKVRLKAYVRRGEDSKGIRSALRESVRQRLERGGIPLKRLKVRMVESNPRQTATRVQ